MGIILTFVLDFLRSIVIRQNDSMMIAALLCGCNSHSRVLWPAWVLAAEK